MGQLRGARLKWALGFGAASAIAAAAACSSSSDGGGQPIPGTDGGAGSETSTATATLKVVVYDWTVVGRTNQRTPSANATVTMTKPGGATETQTTDAEGHVTFTNLDWSLGNASLVASKDGNAAYGVAEINPGNIAMLDDGPLSAGVDLALYMFPQKSASDTVAITAQNKADEADWLLASADIASGNVSTKTDALTLHTLGSGAFTLVSCEYSLAKAPSARELLQTTVRWTRYDGTTATPPTTNVTLDLADGGTTLATSVAHVHGVVPQGQSGSLANCTMGVSVASEESNGSLLFGTTTKVTLGADKASFDATIETATLADETPNTYYFLETTAGAYSLVRVGGAPVEGSTIDTFLSPLAPALTVSLSQPIDLSKADPQSRETRLSVYDATFTTLLFNVDVPAGTTSFTVPALPPSITGALTGAKGTLDSFTDIDANNAYRRAAQSHSFNVTP